MEGKEVRQLLLKIFGSQIRFNKTFDSHIARLKESMLNEFIEWCKRCKENKEFGSVPQKKNLKIYMYFLEK